MPVGLYCDSTFLSYCLEFSYLFIYAFFSVLLSHPSVFGAHFGTEPKSPFIKVGWSRL
jgi:hypothetical protein